MPTSTEDTLARIERSLHDEFPNIRLEFSSQYFSNHVEMWVYVLDLKEYERVRDRCRQFSEQERLDQHEPEVWLMAKTWTGSWPGGESEQEIKQRREEFRRLHAVA